MKKYLVYDEASELSSEAYLTEKEAQNDLDNDISYLWSMDAKIVEVDD